jgi:phenylacetate-CoA ligase
VILDFLTILKIFGFPIKKARSIFRAAKSEKDFPAWQDEMRWGIFRFHFCHNAFYKSIVKTHPPKWEDIPVLRRGDLRDNYLLKIPSLFNKFGLYHGSTSGSSGNPLFFAQDKLCHAIIWINVDHFYSKAGISLNDRQARAFGIVKKALSFYTERIKDWMSNRYRFNIFDLSERGFELWLERFKKDNFKYLYGYTNSLLALASYLRKNKLTLSSVAPSLTACIVTSEVCTSKDKELLEEAFGIKVFNEYGSSELGIMGFKTDDVWEASDELIYFEVLDENGNVLPDGEIGLLTCTSLFNKATPFIRYQTGDLASIIRRDGRTFIQQLMGSQNDMAILPSGKKVPGISFYFVAKDLLGVSTKIREFLFRQTNRAFIFEYVAEADISEKDFQKLKKGFEIYLEESVPIEALRVNKLCRGESGKFKHFISNLNR